MNLTSARERAGNLIRGIEFAAGDSGPAIFILDSSARSILPDDFITTCVVSTRKSPHDSARARVVIGVTITREENRRSSGCRYRRFVEGTLQVPGRY